MIWKGRNSELEDCKAYWRKYFCLLPRNVQGYNVWLTYIEANRKFYTYESWFRAIKRGWWSDVKEFRLTERQKAKLGLKW